MCSSSNCGSLFTFPPISRQEQPLRIKKGDTLSPRVIRGSFQPARRSKALPYTSIERVGRKGLSLLPVECEIRQGNIRSANDEQGHAPNTAIGWCRDISSLTQIITADVRTSYARNVL